MSSTITVMPPTAEPVSVAFFKSYARLDTDLEDALLQAFLSAARNMAESYCGCYFADRVVETTYTIAETCPIAPESILAVSGAFTSVAELAASGSYFNEYRKGIIVSRDNPIDYDHLPTYTVRYAVVVSALPADVQVAICKIAADLYENRENGGGGELGISYKALLAPYRKYA